MEEREQELTLDDVCKRLQLRPLTLKRFLKSIGFRAIQGGKGPLFTEADYLEIREARRKCRSRSSIPAPAKPPITGSAARSRSAIGQRPSLRVQEFLTRNSPAKSSRSVNRRSTANSSPSSTAPPSSQVIPLKRPR